MSSAEHLRDFVNQRLTAAAEEIFGAFQKCIVGYEEEIHRQRRLWGIVWKPDIKLQRIELPQHHVCEEEEEILADQQICNQERNSSLDQEDPEPQMKEEQEEVCTSQEGEQLVLKEDTDSFMVTPTYEENDNNEDQTLDLNPDESLSEPQRESVVNRLVISSVVGAPDGDLQLQSNNSRAAESQDQEHEPCEKDLRFEPNFHKRKNTGEKKKFISKTCGKHFTRSSNLKDHLRIHTGEKKKCICKTCGKHFRHTGDLNRHLRIHTGERPYICETCGKHYRQSGALNRHMRMHTGEKPYICETCGKHYRQSAHLKVHVRIHTEEKPYICETCGKHYRQSGGLSRHTRMHTGEKPYICETCGKRYRQSTNLKVHMRIHTDESVKV